MRKFMTVFFMLFLISSGVSAPAYATDCSKDSAMDQFGDWISTIGKKNMEKDQVLAKRKADRMLACAKREARKAAEEVKKSGADMKKRLGL